MQVGLVGVAGCRRDARRRGPVVQQPDCAAEPQDAPQRRGPVAVNGGALTLQRAARPTDIAGHIRYGRAVFEAVGDVVQLAKRPRRRLLRRLVCGQGSGQPDKRAVPRTLDAEIRQQNTAVAQLRCRNAEQPGQGSWSKPQAHIRFSTPRTDERGGVRTGDDNAARHPDEIHAAIGQNADRLRRSVHHPRAFDEFAQVRRRWEVAVAHSSDVTAEWARPRLRRRCPLRRAGA